MHSRMVASLGRAGSGNIDWSSDGYVQAQVKASNHPLVPHAPEPGEQEHQSMSRDGATASSATRQQKHRRNVAAASMGWTGTQEGGNLVHPIPPTGNLPAVLCLLLQAAATAAVRVGGWEHGGMAFQRLQAPEAAASAAADTTEELWSSSSAADCEGESAAQGVKAGSSRGVIWGGQSEEKQEKVGSCRLRTTQASPPELHH